MSRHRVRLLPDGRYMCSKPRCRFVGTWDEASAHLNEESKQAKRDAA